MHHIIESELGGQAYPCGKHEAKAALLAREYADAEPKRLSFAVFTGLSQIAYHARRMILKVLEELRAILIRAAEERAMAFSRPVG